MEQSCNIMPNKITTKQHHTRSKTSQFEKKYSFDEASKEWNKNKIKKNNCYYEYINCE
jgi:hypothetical protein